MSTGQPTRLEFDAPPPRGPAVRRILFSRKPGLRAGGSVPRIEGAIRAVAPDPARVAQYRRVCGFAPSRELPLPYPQVLASSLHLALATAPEFPLPAMGLVHVRNLIVQRRPIGEDETLRIECVLEGGREVELGIEIDVVTRVFAGSEAVWEGTSTALSRRKQAAARREKRAPEPHAERASERSAILRVPEDMGRVYAAVSGDSNPIHTHALTAKLFGFPRAIVHGMWSLARSLAELDRDVPPSGVRVECAFKKPIFLPSRVLFSSRREGSALQFAMRTPDGAAPHLLGTVGAAPPV